MGRLTSQRANKSAASYHKQRQVARPPRYASGISNESASPQIAHCQTESLSGSPRFRGGRYRAAMGFAGQRWAATWSCWAGAGQRRMGGSLFKPSSPAEQGRSLPAAPEPLLEPAAERLPLPPRMGDRWVRALPVRLGRLRCIERRLARRGGVCVLRPVSILLGTEPVLCSGR